MEDVPGVGGIYLQLECWVAVRYKVFLQDRFKINPWSMNRPCVSHTGPKDTNVNVDHHLRNERI